MQDTTEEVHLDDVLDVLANVQRRSLLVSLLGHSPKDDTPIALSESSQDREAVHKPASMHHVHLPKLADHGFIEWDREHHQVTKGPNFDEIRPLLELLSDHEDELPDGWP
jgi:hypothetical protein